MKKRNKSSPKARYGVFSIANQLRYGFVLLIVVALLSTSGALIYLSFQTQLQQLAVVQEERSHAVASAIDAYLDDLQRKLGYLARVQGLTDLSPQIQTQFLEALIRHNSAYESVMILDNTGQVVSAVAPYGQKPAQNLAESPSFRRPFYQQEDFVSPAEVDPITRLPIVTLSVPIRNQQDQVDGVLLSRISLKFLWFFLYQTDIGKTGYAYVIDNRNFLIAEKGQAPDPFILKDLSQQPFIQRLSGLGEGSLATYSGLKGVDVIGATAPIRSLRWQVVVELPTTEAYAPIRNMLGVMGGALIATTALATGLGIIYSRKIVLPLQRLTQAAAQISMGNLDAQVKVPRWNELGTLAATFNEMAAQLQALVRDLSQERNFVSTILDTAGALVIVVDRRGRIIRFNRACEDVTHYDFTEVKDRYFWDFLLIPEEVEPVKALFADIQTGEFPGSYESYWLTKEGQQRLIAWSTTLLRDEDTSIKYVIGIGIDITERRQAEMALKESEERFRLMVEGSEQVFFYIHDTEHRWQYLSPSVQAVLGYQPEELIGHAYEDLLTKDPTDCGAAELARQAMLTGGERNLPYVVLLQHKDGRSIYLEIVETLIQQDGQAAGVQGFARDITERKWAEEQLRVAVERDRLLGEIALRIRRSLDLEQIVNTTVVEVRQLLRADRVFIGYVTEGDRGQVVAESVDPQWNSILGEMNDEALVKEIRELFTHGGAQAIDDVFTADLSPLRAQSLAVDQAQASLGVPIVVKEQFFGVLVAHQCVAPRHWEAFEIDLLERLATQVAIAIQQAQLFQEVQTLNTNLERQVEERTAQLQQKMQELQDLYQRQDEFLHAVSHDLRTPIVGTLLVLKNLQNQPGDNLLMHRKVLERMIQSGDRQLSLINSLLEAHSSEMRGLALQCEPVQLNELVQSIVEDLGSLLVKNRADLVNLVTDELPLVKADPLQLRRVFENLLTNALNHNPPGLKLSISAQVEEDMISCAIRDNGVGMTQSQCDQLFERYARGDRARSTGVGLGLYLCRQIITAHGGQIGAISSLGAGATFWFTLPLMDAVPSQ